MSACQAVTSGGVSLSPVAAEAVEELQKLDCCQDAWLAVREEAARLVVRIGGSDWAACLELCGKTYEKTMWCVCMRMWQSAQVAS